MRWRIARTQGGLPQVAPAPFHYDPALESQIAKGRGLANLANFVGKEERRVYENGTDVWWKFYDLNYPQTDWARTGTVIKDAESRLESLVGGSEAILEDPLFGGPVKFILVDKIYGAGSDATGLNTSQSMLYWTNNKLTEANFARLIQIKVWNDSDASAHEAAIEAIVHEIGHSWNNVNYPTAGLSTTPWTQNWQSYMQKFEALSGWVNHPTNTKNLSEGTKGTPKEEDDWWYRTGSEFTRDYAHSNPNEDWADTFELASRLGPLPPPKLPSGLIEKVQKIKEFLNLVVPTKDSLGHCVLDYTITYIVDAGWA
jgi:hypothetical protein